MNKSMVMGVLLGGVVVTAGGAMAGFNLLDRESSYAEVLEVTPVTETVRTPREACHDETVTHKKPVRDEHQVTGTLVGAVVGGVIGNQIGGGSGKKVATVAGAAAGGYAGNRVQKNIQDNNTYTTTETRCETVYDSSEQQIGYDVKYRLGDTVDVVRMERDPGDRIPVQDGKLVLADSSS